MHHSETLMAITVITSLFAASGWRTPPWCSMKAV